VALEDTAYTIQASDLLQGFSDIDSPSLSVINLSSSSGFLQDNLARIPLARILTLTAQYN
jgi:hypothetical protein